MQLVVIESPWQNGKEPNLIYARLAVRDSLARGEAPYASHLLYTQPMILRDAVPEERERGMQAGFAWGAMADLVAVYDDLGITRGMSEGISVAEARGITIVYRRLPPLIVGLVNQSAGDSISGHERAMVELSNPGLRWEPIG